MSDEELQDRPSRESLEAQADEVRAKLATTLGRLDRKRHEIAHLADVPAQIEEHVVPIAAGAAIVLVGTGALITWSIVRVVTAPQRRPQQRIEALRRAWFHPENVGRKRSTFVGDLVRKLATGIVTTVALQMLKKAIQSPELAEAFPQLALLQGKPRRKRTRPSAISGSRRTAIPLEPLEESGSTLAITNIARTGDAG
jgi:hypothetical protein